MERTTADAAHDGGDVRGIRVQLRTYGISGGTHAWDRVSKLQRCGVGLDGAMQRHDEPLVADEFPPH